MIAVPYPERYERAKTLYASAVQLEATGAPRAAVDLYRQATFWALGALAPVKEAAWPTLLTGAPNSIGVAAEQLQSSAERDEALEAPALDLTLQKVRVAAADAMAAVEAPQRALDLREHQAIVRRAAALIIGLVVVLGAVVAAGWLLQPVDLAKGKPWRVSSKIYDCHPERIECGGVRTPILFHTNMENEPWFEIDLGQPTRFSSVAVFNRSDGWGDRAFPLQLEVGDDQKTWRPLARQDEEVKVWQPKFDPVTARYVRLRVLRQSLLHLDGVRVYP